MRWNDVGNHLYAVWHGREQLNELWPEVYSENDSFYQQIFRLYIWFLIVWLLLNVQHS